MAKQTKNEKVVLKHSKYKGRPVVSRRAFENVWKSKGYTIDEKAPAATTSASTGS